MYIVYQITFNDEIIYIGRTNNIKRRQSEHNTRLKSGYKKDVYTFLKEKGISNISLQPIKEFKTAVDAKRYEMLLILQDYFSSNVLKQKVPQIKDF